MNVKASSETFIKIRQVYSWNKNRWTKLPKVMAQNNSAEQRLALPKKTVKIN